LPCSEAVLVRARACTDNLSATVEPLLEDSVVAQHNAQRGRRCMADACAADWNAVRASIGSFADEHAVV
jgi:antitoxin CcdA